MSKITRHAHPVSHHAGLTLVELLVTVSILGALTALGIVSFLYLIRRERVQSVALETAGWIEGVRNAAADEINPTTTQGGCLINFTAAPLMAAGATLATIPDANCTRRGNVDDPDSLPPNEELLIPNTIQQNTVTVEITEGGDTVIFTPRGLWTDGEGATGVPFLMTITLDGGGPFRCVRLTETLGSVEIGRPGSGDTDCTQWQTL